MKAAVRVFLFVLFCASLVLAQGSSTAELHGTVKDPKGAVVSGATITVRDATRGVDLTTKSDASGEFRFTALRPGQYVVTVEAPSFAKFVGQNLTLTIGQRAELPVTLALASVTAEVTVSAETQMIEPERTSTTTTIGPQRIENLPINGRDYIKFAQTDSQVVRDTAPSIGAAPTSGLNFNGQRARSNLVNVDGVDYVDNSVNGIRSTVSQDAVQEFQIIKDGYAPEYGRAAGGVVNIITRTGTNALHGSAFGFLRNRNIQATNPFSTVENPAYTRVQAGFSLGGALKKDKTFYFLSYEVTRRHETGFSTIGDTNFGFVPLPNAASFGLPATALVTPDQAAFLATAGVNPLTVAYAQLAAGGAAVALAGSTTAPGPLNAFPTTGAPLPLTYSNLLSNTGNYPVFEGTSLYSARLDHHFTANNTGMLRLNVSPSTMTGLQVNAQNQNFGQNAFSRTSIQQYRDFGVTFQDTWIIGNNKINEGRFQYARRGLLYDFNTDTPAGSTPGVNIVGFAFIGREPFSSLTRTEQRYEVGDNFSWVLGKHNVKFGGDVNVIPVDAAFQVNFGGVYNFSSLQATDISPFFAGFPGFNAVQAYGFGVPQTFVQGIGNPNDSFTNKPIGFFIQDSWKLASNLTFNYGVRYDVEIAPQFAVPNALSAAAYNALHIQKGYKTDWNNVAPRVGIAWDPMKDGKTVVRASYGMFYDHPLLGILFLGDATDGVGTPQTILFGGSPCNPAAPPSPLNNLNLNATNTFQGLAGVGNCLGPGAAAALGIAPGSQLFDPFQPNSLWINENFLGAGFPLINQPFGFPTGQNFVYAYSEQANLSVERALGSDFALSVGYDFNGGHHLNRPINANPVNQELLMGNFERAVMFDGYSPTGSPYGVLTCDPANNVFPAALMSFFRPSGINPSMAGLFSACLPFAQAFASANGLGLGVPVPFSDMVANFSNGSSIYHGMTVNLRKRMSHHYEFLASYTWSHAIDDSTDLQSLLSPQDSRFPSLERASSTFDQRHHFVISAVYQSGKVSGDGFWPKFLSDWTVAPIIDAGSGRPFTILTGANDNLQFSPNDARPNVVAAGTPPNACGFAAVPSSFSPTGFFQEACVFDGTFDGVSTASGNGNLGRNSATKPMTLFTDMRIGRRFNFNHERVHLDATMDLFNAINRFNVADVNPLFTAAGQPSAAFDPRQFQFGMRFSW
jgi:carboxypeptidase family protein/TonB-dependent receptor-like protein